jgi:hypothetical protein
VVEYSTFALCCFCMQLYLVVCVLIILHLIIKDFFFWGGGGVHFIELNLATKVAFFVLFFVCGTVEGDV